MPLLQMIGTQYSPYVAVAAFCCVAGVLSCILAIRKLRFTHMLLAAAGMLLAVMAQRNGIICTFFMLPLVLWNISHGKAFLPDRSIIRFFIPAAATFALLVAASVNHFRMLTTWPRAVSPFSQPTETAALPDIVPDKGNLFNADRYGGYLIWKHYPHLKVAIDTRLTLRSGAFYREYLAFIEEPRLFDIYARTWNITRVVLPVAPIDRYLALAAYLYRHHRWKCIFTDGTEILFSADTSTTHTAIDLDSPSDIATINASLKKRFSDSSPLYEEASSYLGRLCSATGALNGARLALSGCQSPGGRCLLARIMEQQGHTADAERLLKQISAYVPRNQDVRLNLALFYLRNNRPEAALRELSLLLKKDPFNKRARNVLFELTGDTTKK
jgi:hypothetical protein